MPVGLNSLPSIWQSHINAVLECLQSRNYCEAIVDYLLLFTPTKKSHIAKLEGSNIKNRITVHGKNNIHKR